MKACPYRNDFYEKLGAQQAVVTVELNAWLRGLRSIVDQTQGFYDKGNYGKGL